MRLQTWSNTLIDVTSKENRPLSRIRGRVSSRCRVRPAESGSKPSGTGSGEKHGQYTTRLEAE